PNGLGKEPWTSARTELRRGKPLVNGGRQDHRRCRLGSTLTCCHEGGDRSVCRPSQQRQRGRSHKEAAPEVSESLLRFFSAPGSSFTPRGARGFTKCEALYRNYGAWSRGRGSSARIQITI